MLPNWHRRGIPEEMATGKRIVRSVRKLSKCRSLADHAECLIRCSPGEDATNGFFVSCFVRQSRGELTHLGKRSQPSVNPGTNEGDTGERGEGIIHMEKDTDGQERKRPKKKRKSSMLT